MIDLPDLESQNKVAKILCDLNDKIISNEKINYYFQVFVVMQHSIFHMQLLQSSLNLRELHFQHSGIL